jgi:hypothetical protein
VIELANQLKREMKCYFSIKNKCGDIEEDIYREWKDKRNEAEKEER